MTIRDFLDNSATKFSKRPAQRFHRDGEWKTRSYAELRELVIRLAAAVRVFGIEPGRDNVALMMENCPEWEVIYLAFVCVGITVVPMDPKLREREVQHILTDSGAVAIFAGGKLAPMIIGMAKNLPALKTCVFAQGASASTSASTSASASPDGVTVVNFNDLIDGNSLELKAKSLEPQQAENGRACRPATAAEGEFRVQGSEFSVSHGDTETRSANSQTEENSALRLPPSALDSDAIAWFDSHRPADGDVASILYTSGTTGNPKGAMLTHANFEANADFAKNIIPFSETDDFLVILPLFHAFSFAFSFLVPLYVGGCSSFARSLKTISEDIRIIKPTTILAVPLLAEKMFAKIDANLKKSKLAKFLMAIGLSCIVGKKVREGLGGKLRIMAIGGAPTDRGVLRGFKKFGIPAVEGYGLTECGPLVCFSPTSVYKIGTVGHILTCMTYKVCDKDSTGAGELRVKGPNVMKGYFKNPEATTESFDEDGYLRTGDIVREDSDGSLSICGRYKALIVNREGKNIYPEEIEQLMARCPLIAESVAVGYKVSGETGEHVGLIVVPNADACDAAGIKPEDREHAIREAIAEICKTSLANYKIPRKTVVRDTPLEHTSTMKVRRVVYKGALDE